MIIRMTFILSLIYIWLPAAAFSQQPITRPYNRFTLHWENDYFGETDRDYSNGLKLTWSTAFSAKKDEKRNLPGWIYDIAEQLPHISDSSTSRALSVSLGQNIYTPEETGRRELIEDDRPYAGFTYLGLGFVARKGTRLDVYELEVGIVGPLSLSENTQDSIHNLIGSETAKGWNHQLKNEPGLEVIRETKWRIWTRDFGGGFSVDLIPHLGWRLGNIAIYANTGTELRFGWDLPPDFGTCPIRPGCNIGDPQPDLAGGRLGMSALGVQVFLAVDGRFVLHNLFLDGNTFTDSHSVNKKPLVADLIAGVGFQYGRARLTYSYIYRTPEFEERDDELLFGAITLSWLY